MITAHIEPGEEADDNPRLVIGCDTEDPTAITYTGGRLEIVVYVSPPEVQAIRDALDGAPA